MHEYKKESIREDYCIKDSFMKLVTVISRHVKPTYIMCKRLSGRMKIFGQALLSPDAVEDKPTL
jgi:hypothetical protein